MSGGRDDNTRRLHFETFFPGTFLSPLAKTSLNITSSSGTNTVGFQTGLGRNQKAAQVHHVPRDGLEPATLHWRMSACTKLTDCAAAQLRVGLG